MKKRHKKRTPGRYERVRFSKAEVLTGRVTILYTAHGNGLVWCEAKGLALRFRKKRLLKWNDRVIFKVNRGTVTFIRKGSKKKVESQ